MPNLKTYKNAYGTTINIHYLNSVEDTINLNSLNIFIQDIHNNFGKYNNTIFSNLQLNIWNKERSDIPPSVKKCDPITGICTITDYGIKEFGGLTWGPQNRIDLNSILTGNDFDLSNLLSHEVGHLIDFKTDFDDPNDIIMSEWRKIRGSLIGSHNPVEVMAEDIRYFFGSRLAKGYERGDHPKASLVRGLHDLLLIWKPVSAFIKAGKPGYILKSTEFIYSSTDFDYCSIKLKYSRWRRFLWWQWEEIISFQLDRNNI